MLTYCGGSKCNSVDGEWRSLQSNKARQHCLPSCGPESHCPPSLPCPPSGGAACTSTRVATVLDKVSSKGKTWLRNTTGARSGGAAPRAPPAHPVPSGRPLPSPSRSSPAPADGLQHFSSHRASAVAPIAERNKSLHLVTAQALNALRSKEREGK